MLHPHFLTDRYRLIRSFLVGSLVYLVSIQFLSFKESFTLSVTFALAWDFIQLLRHTWLLSIEQTRSIFTRWESKESFVAMRTIALVFMSIGILSFCISDLQHSSSVLPKSVHTLTTFFALFSNAFFDDPLITSDNWTVSKNSQRLFVILRPWQLGV